MSGADIVVIAPHPDDESLGCGGTIRRECQRGSRVSVLFLTSGERGVSSDYSSQPQLLREAEALGACEVLGVSEARFLRGPDGGLSDLPLELVDRLTAELSRLQAGRLFLPHPNDAHPDHAAALSLVSMALGRTATRPSEVIGYEIWTPISSPHWVQDITDEMETKMEAVRRYSSQLAEFRYDRAVSGLNAYRGELQAKCRFAEAFVALEPPS